MRSDKPQLTSLSTTRQKVTAGVFVIILLLVLWQVFGMFRGGSKTTAVTQTTTTAQSGKMSLGGPTHSTPQSTELIKAPSPQMTQREMQLMQLQQETEAKYVAAMNELQMLKVSREIAETNQAIASAKLATVTAEKSIMNLLSVTVPEVSQGTYAKGLVGPVSSGTPVTKTPPLLPVAQPQQPQVPYSVISVTQLQSRWGAVLGAQGNLYNVSVGDILPPDGSKVISINKSGVTLQKDGTTRRISLVPII